MDIHAHSFYSACGKDAPKTVLDAAMRGGIELFAFTDHNYGIGTRKKEYADLMGALKGQYADRLTLLCGIEVSTYPEKYDMTDELYRLFDFCLIESPADPRSVAYGRLFEFADAIPIVKGIAHTDLFAYCAALGYDPTAFFARMGEKNIFWEMNISYDSIHGYREHAYMKRFFFDEKEQALIRDLRVPVSIGFDGHRVEDYLPERVRAYNEKLHSLGVRTADTLF